MSDRPEANFLGTEFCKERSIRRTVKVVEAKRKRIREELEQLILHLALLVPVAGANTHSLDSSSDLLLEALNRIEDDAFTQLLLQVLQEVR